MSSQMPGEILKALDKAADALENANYNLAGGFTLAAANRAYYACYYCMTAMLLTKEVFPKTHQGIHAKFAELFIKTGIFPKETSDTVTLLFDNRQQADYDLDADISVEEAKELIQKAYQLLQLTKKYFDALNSQ